MSDFIRFNKLYNSLTINNTLIHVGKLLERAYAKYPNNDALICDEEKISYKELYYKANLCSKMLLDKQINKNDRVIILYQNSIDFYIAYFAIWTIGAIVVPINIFLKEQEIINIIKDSNPKILIISAQFIEKFPNLATLGLPIISQVSNKEENYNIDIEIVDRDIQEVAAILYTSGTTGNPKGVMLTSKNIIVNAIQGFARFQASHQDKIYCPMPLFHSFPQNVCMWSTVIIGATAITSSKIDRSKIINALKHNPTVVMCVPAIYGLFCKMKNLNFESVRFFISGGDILSDKIRKYFELIYRRKLCNGYGLTETSPFIAVNLDNYTQNTNTIGAPLWGINCQIRDSNSEILGINKVGVLWINGENVMKGYYNQEEKTKEVIKDGWFNTEDLAYINQDGKIVITGREKDLIKSKGIKIYPSEIENLILTNDKVIQAAVLGKKITQEKSTDYKSEIDAEEEYPVAFIATHEKDIEKLQKDLINLVRTNLASYKVPREFIIKRDLPISATGKVDKKALKVLLEQDVEQKA